MFISLVIGTIHCYTQEPRTGASIYQAYYKYYLDRWMDKWIDGWMSEEMNG